MKIKQNVLNTMLGYFQARSLSLKNLTSSASDVVSSVFIFLITAVLTWTVLFLIYRIYNHGN